MVKIAAGAKGSRYAGDDSGETNLTYGFHNKGPSFASNGRALMFSATPRQRRTFAVHRRRLGRNE
jgi:Tol biopolymer transport system component